MISCIYQAFIKGDGTIFEGLVNHQTIRHREEIVSPRRRFVGLRHPRNDGLYTEAM